MRLIIFVKIPEQVEPIPLDIIDNRPSRSVLEDILIIAKLSNKNNPLPSYFLSLNGNKLDPDLDLSQNGVKNGTILELVKSNEQAEPANRSQSKVVIQEAQAEIKETPKAITRTQKKSDKQIIPGKKIEFD